MKNRIIAIVAAIGLSVAVASPANAWWRGGWGGYGPVGWGYGGGYGYGGGWGYGGYGYGAAAGAAGLAIGALAGAAIASQNYYSAPAYAVPVAPAAPRVKKNIIIKNSPGATVIEEDDIFGW